MKPSGVSRRHKSPSCSFTFSLERLPSRLESRGSVPGQVTPAVQRPRAGPQARINAKRTMPNWTWKLIGCCKGNSQNNLLCLTFHPRLQWNIQGWLTVQIEIVILFIIPIKKVCNSPSVDSFRQRPVAFAFCFFGHFLICGRRQKLGHLRGRNKHLEEGSVPFSTFAKIFAEWSKQNVAKGGMFQFQGISLRG